MSAVWRAEGTVEGKVDSTPVTLSLAITGDAVADAAVLAQFPNVATGCRVLRSTVRPTLAP
jgi:hypothetical protein